MTDVAKRIRSEIQRVNDGWPGECAFDLELAEEAAAEVERLRAALREVDEIGRVAAQVPGPRNKLMEICARARTALKEDGDE